MKRQFNKSLSKMLGTVGTVVVMGGAISTTPASAANNGYGAISFSPSTGRYGYTYGYDHWGTAAAAASKYCGVSDCRWVVSYQHGCGAVAYNQYGYRAGQGNTKQAAEQQALNKLGTSGRTISACSY